MKTRQFANLPDIGAYVELITELKSDFAADFDVRKYVALTRKNTLKRSKLADMQLTEPKESDVGETHVIEYEMTGTFKDVKLHYRIFVLERNGWFCQVECWTVPSHWQEAQTKFEECLKSLK